MAVEKTYNEIHFIVVQELSEMPYHQISDSLQAGEISHGRIANARYL